MSRMGMLIKPENPFNSIKARNPLAKLMVHSENKKSVSVKLRYIHDIYSVVHSIEGRNAQTLLKKLVENLSSKT